MAQFTCELMPSDKLTVSRDGVKILIQIEAEYEDCCMFLSRKEAKRLRRELKALLREK